MTAGWIEPDWPAPRRVRAVSTTRSGGCSRGPYRSFNLGAHCGDAAAAVERNRAVLRAVLPAEPCWLRQVHGTGVLVHGGDSPGGAAPPEADAQISRRAGLVCAILTADCLPVLLCDRRGTEVAAAHAGWRGLAAGVLERTVQAMTAPPGSLLAWLGPAIGPAAYEVGDDVRAAFAPHQAEGARAFRPQGSRWLFNLYAMARHCLARAGVEAVWGGNCCTHTDAGRFFSHRRDGVCGRMATLIWLEE
jgi:hypothetical protein